MGRNTRNTGNKRNMTNPVISRKIKKRKTKLSVLCDIGSKLFEEIKREERMERINREVKKELERMKKLREIKRFEGHRYYIQNGYNIQNGHNIQHKYNTRQCRNLPNIHVRPKSYFEEKRREIMLRSHTSFRIPQFINYNNFNFGNSICKNYPNYHNYPQTK